MKKKLSRFDKFVLFLNLVAVALLLLACFVPSVRSLNLSYLSLLGLGVPLLVVTHFLFLLYWAVRRKRHFVYSLLIILISYASLDSFYKIPFSTDKGNGDLKIMSYNVRCFNRYEELPSKTILEDIKAFVKKEDPDILCIQESFYDSDRNFGQYPYNYLQYFHMMGKGLLAVFSKYPIINTGLLNLPRTDSNAIYVDIQYKNDTIRVYNVHLESLGITPGQGVLSKEPTDKLFRQVSHAFRKQLEQAQVIEDHISSSPYKSVLCGDFNNGQYSNVYRMIRGDFQDTFLEAGKGYGRTFLFHGVPLRIDFILADRSFEVESHVNYDVSYSDHYPVMASFKWHSDEITIR